MKFLEIIFYLLILSGAVQTLEEPKKVIMNFYYEDNNITTKISEKEDKKAVAYAIYNNSYEITGWDFIYVSSYEKKDNKYNDSLKSYAMGYLEGVLTKDRIYNFYTNIIHSNFYKDDFQIPENVSLFFEENLNYMKKKSEENMDKDEYWEQVHYIYQQLKGLVDGYNSAVEEDKKIDFISFQMMTAITDYYDILYYNPKNRPNFDLMTNEQIKSFLLLKSRCSALVKLGKNFSDIWIGHNTWDGYNNMMKMFKEYHFVSNKGNEKSKTSVFPSYPATLVSLDDYYYLDSKLIVMETTNSIFDESLFDLLSPETLLTWVRTYIANRLASSAEEWTEIFEKENSGTVNNQFIILDLNNINFDKKELPDKTLMILEQIPGEVEINDVTQYLREGYWPSYNIPFSPYIYNKSGYVDFIKKRPEFNVSLDYNNCPRAQIFRRDQENINSNEDFKHIIRYNDYENDPLSDNDPSEAIACRYDLNPENDSYCFGANDAKFISVKELMEGKNIIYIIAGPTNDQQPTFSWKNATCYIGYEDDYYHEGVVDTWNFSWIDYKIHFWNEKDDDGINKTLIIIIAAGAVVFIILLILIIICIKRKKAKNQDIENNSLIRHDNQLTVLD